jgi:plastocyanin
MPRRSLVLAVTGGLLLVNAFASLPAKAGGCHPESPEASSATGGDTVTVPVKKCEFGPTVIHVPEGAEVTWVNHDPVPHTVTGANLEWGSAEEIHQTDTVQYRFDESGTYPYQCFLHPGMTGAVVVGDGESNDLAAAPVPVAPSSASKPSSDGSTTRETSTGGPGVASTVALAALALAAGVGAGIAIKSRGPGRGEELPQT